MIYDDYIQYCTEYTNKYGEDTVILMEVGGFFELYGVNYDGTQSGADIYNVASMLGIQVSRKNKNIIENSITNPLLSGFPSYTLHKFIDILITNNKTVVLVEQTTPPPNPKREVTQIISPATYDRRIHNNEATNYILHFFLEAYNNQKSIAVGIACIDCSTGKTIVDEIHNVTDHNILYEELQKIIIYVNPKEVVISSTGEIDSSVENELLQMFPHKIKVYNKIKQLTIDVTKPIFQQHVYEMHYTNESQLSVFEFLNIERKLLGSIAFAYLIHFVQQYNPSTTLNVYKPESIGSINKLKIAHNAPVQLNITEGRVTLLDILNQCNTSIGKRYFRHRLLNPSTDVKELEESYSHIKDFKEFDIEHIRNELKNVKDIEKLFHKQSLKIFPQDILNIYKSISIVKNLCHEMKIFTAGYSSTHQEGGGGYSPTHQEGEGGYSATQVLTYLESIFCFDNENIFNSLDENIFIDVSCNEMHQLIIKKNISKFNDFVSMLNDKTQSDHFKLDHNDREGYHVVCTLKRFKQYSSQPPPKQGVMGDTPPHVNLFETCNVSHNKTTTKIYCKHDKEYNDAIFKANCDIKINFELKFTKAVNHVKDCFKTEIRQCIDMIEYIDFYSTCVCNNQAYGLSPPQIDSTHTDSGFLNAKSLRHPIIQEINKNVEYIANDVSLDESGIVLYGINASGKSSLMKSIGLAVIMAQSGMYVAADEFIFNPFTSIYTRITGSDNLYKNQSTFVLEMSELRTILECADNKSLIIGDELCSGTETISAVSIVSAGIQILANKKSSFIFATHLHELKNFIHQDNVQLCHLSVEYDNDQIIYDRKLKQGIGNTLYGLEVCKSLDMSAEFIKLAFDIRNKYTNSQHNVSSYNSQIIKHTCCVCKTEPAVDVHHINEQQNADENGFIGIHHKNDAHNLVSLCVKCHHAVHSNQLNIKGYRMTNRGRELVYERLDTFNYDEDSVINRVIEIRKHTTVAKSLIQLNEIYPGANFTNYRVSKMVRENIFK